MGREQDRVRGNYIPPVNKPGRDVVDRLMKGAIDMHMHAAPDPTVERRDVMEVAEAAEKYGMRAVVLKSFFYPTVCQTALGKYAAPDVELIGSITIGEVTTGGLDHGAAIIENNAKLGCKVVWFPAFDAKFCRSEIGQEGGIWILDEQGNVKSQVYDILRVVKKWDMVLCSGHMSYEETEKLFLAAKEMGITKMIATHPQVNEWTPMNIEQMKRLVDIGAYIEHCYLQLTARSGSLHPTRFVEITHAVGAEHCIMVSDFGWASEMVSAEALRSFIGTMLTFGCTEEEVRYMVQENPAKLLGL